MRQIVLSFFLFFGIIANGFSASENQIVLALGTDPKSFNTIVSKESTTSDVLGLTFECLTRIDGASTEILPNLALSWKSEDNGLKWTFQLREDVFWFDGKKFTADDVVFTFNQLIFNPAVDTLLRDILIIDNAPIQVKAISPFEIQFILPKSFAPFLLLMSGVEILPKHVLEEVVQKGEFNSHWGVFSDPKSVIGTGPYMLDSYQAGQSIVLKKNPKYWRKGLDPKTSLPYLDKIIYSIVPNEDAALMKFQQMELDVYPLKGADFSILKPLERVKQFTIYDTGPQFGSNFLIFNQNSKKNEKGVPFVDPVKQSWFNNIYFRKAIAHAIDRQSIIDILMYGFGHEEYGPISPAASFFFNSKIVQYPYDLKKSKALLTQAGFNWKNGKLYDHDSHPVAFSLLTNSDNTTRVKISELIRKDLSELGIQVNFLTVEFNNLVNRVSVTYDWDCVLMGLTGGIEPHFGRNVWHTTGRMHFWNPDQTQPETEWEKRIDEIFDQGVSEMDPQKRKILYDEFQYIVSDQLPLIYTILSDRIIAVRNKYNGLKPSAYGGVLHNLEEWQIISSDV